MKSVSLLDRLIHKPVTVEIDNSIDKTSLQPGDFVIYTDDDWKDHVWEYLWYHVKDAKKQTFKMLLEWTNKTNFDHYQKEAATLFALFAEDFGKEFPDAVTICWRESVWWNQVYFYFYAEERYNFADFVRRFREKVKKKFFIYQVWSRDRVRLHPNRDERFDASGLPLMYSIFRHPLPMVDSKVIQLQHLEWRDPERLKDRSWKYDHTLNFERAFYEQEAKRYPQRWSVVVYDGQKTKCIWSNILTQEIKLRGQTEWWKDFRGEWIVISLDEYQKKCTSAKRIPSSSQQQQ